MRPIWIYLASGAVAIAAFLLLWHKVAADARVKCENAVAEAERKTSLAAAVKYQAQVDRLHGIIDKYEATKDIPDPIVVGLAHRLRVYEIHSCQVPAGSQAAGGVDGAIGKSEGDAAVERDTDAVFQACHRDEQRFTALKDWEAARTQ